MGPDQARVTRARDVAASGAGAPDSTAAPQKPEISEDAKALAKILERRYGKFLDAKQIEKLPEEVENRLQGGKRLRDSKLANSDEPDFVFRA